MLLAQIHPLASVALASLFVLAGLALALKFHTVSCGPHEVLVLSGRSRRLPDGSLVGYRVIKGGRALRVPFLETCQRLSLEPIPISVVVSSAFVRGGDRVDLVYEARIKVSGQSPSLERAIERFLGQSAAEIAEIGHTFLEGHARAFLAMRSLSELSSAGFDWAALREPALEADLAKLGLEVVSLGSPRVTQVKSLA